MLASRYILLKATGADKFLAGKQSHLSEDRKEMKGTTIFDPFLSN